MKSLFYSPLRLSARCAFVGLSHLHFSVKPELFLKKQSDHGPEEHPILNSAEATPIMDELDVGEDGRKG